MADDAVPARAGAELRWLRQLATPADMRALDRWSIEQSGVPGLDLMERAGSAVVSTLSSMIDNISSAKIVIACGKGNNGGDGFVVARLLREHGVDVDVLLTAPAAEVSGDAAVNLDRLPGDPPVLFTATGFDGADVVIDALLGTGARGEPSGLVADAVSAIGRAYESGARVVSIDTPTGVDAATGETADLSVLADLTVTFDTSKPGLHIAPGTWRAGTIQTADIGIPSDRRPALSVPLVGTIDRAVLDLVPDRPAQGSKFDSGVVGVIGGSAGLTGAVCLTAQAAMRAGAGYVQAFVPASLTAIVEAKLLEVMTVALPDQDGSFVEDAVGAAVAKLERAGAVVIGPGIGRADATVSAVRALVQQISKPLLIDADGLNAFAGEITALAERRGQTVLTPHAGELGRLLGVGSDEIDARRLHHVREAARLSGATIVLKGPDTLIADPDGTVAINTVASPALATAGSGDVLSGIIGTYLAKGLDPFTAAAAGVHAHSLAGQVAADRHGPNHVIASDVIDALPVAVAR